MTTNEKVTIILKKKGLKSHILDDKNPAKSMCGLLKENQVTIQFEDTLETATCSHCKNTYMGRVMEEDLIKWTEENVTLVGDRLIVKE